MKAGRGGDLSGLDMPLFVSQYVFSQNDKALICIVHCVQVYASKHFDFTLLHPQKKVSYDILHFFFFKSTHGGGKKKIIFTMFNISDNYIYRPLNRNFIRGSKIVISMELLVVHLILTYPLLFMIVISISGVFKMGAVSPYCLHFAFEIGRYFKTIPTHGISTSKAFE